MSFNKVSVIGLGYIGLPTAAVIASRGIDVVGIDVNQHAVDTINAGNIHIVEPDLDIAVRSAVTVGKLRATTIPESADVFMVAVPTPFKGDNHQPDLSYIEATLTARPYFAGSEFSAADIMMTVMLEIADKRGLLKQRVETKKYLERVQSRTAYQAALSLG